jgi:hypothetical protein
MRASYYYHEEAFHLFQYSQIAGAKFDDWKKLLNPPVNLKLLSNDYQLRQTVYNKLFVLRAVTLEYIDNVEDLKAKGKSSVEFLKKEYGIDNQ